MAISGSRVKCALVNIQSVGNKTIEIRDYIKDNKLDVLVLTETWLEEYERAKIKEMTPDTHVFLHVPRENRRGGGVGIFISNSFSKIKKEKVTEPDNFELMQVSCVHGGTKLNFVVVYRRPNSSAASFVDEFQTYIEDIDTVGSEVLVCGDFNFWVDDTENRDAKSFTEAMDTLGFVNRVNKITSRTGHMLDLVLSKANSDLIQSVEVDDVCVLSPVHMVIKFDLKIMLNSKRKENSF